MITDQYSLSHLFYTLSLLLSQSSSHTSLSLSLSLFLLSLSLSSTYLSPFSYPWSLQNSRSPVQSKVYWCRRTLYSKDGCCQTEPRISQLSGFYTKSDLRRSTQGWKRSGCGLVISCHVAGPDLPTSHQPAPMVS